MKKYEWYIPQDVYDEILNEICLFNEQFEQGKVGLTIDDKVLLFYNSIINYLNFENEVFEEILKHNYKFIFGQKFDLDLSNPESVIKVFFNKNMLPYISQFLNFYDNAFFWRAFGVSIETGNHIKNELLDINDSSQIISLLNGEILKGTVLDKKTIAEIILPKIYLIASESLSEDNIYPAHLYRHLYKKFPRIVEFIYNELKIFKTYTPDFSSFIQVTSSEDIKCLEYNPKLIFDLFMNGFMFDSENLLLMIHLGLTTNNIPGFNDAARLLFSMHKYGYEIYNYYLDYCQEKGLEAWIIVESPEDYFVNSYKVPQLKSLCNRYFPSLPEEESKKETKKCFKKIFYALREKKFLSCSINEFLWAFGLTDKYPHGFKRIAFHTTKEKKANGAFLALLKILGYEEDEIKEMRQERKNKPNLINQIFDLSLSRKTKKSKDYLDLLKIVEDSGLPVNG